MIKGILRMLAGSQHVPPRWWRFETIRAGGAPRADENSRKIETSGDEIIVMAHNLIVKKKSVDSIFALWRDKVSYDKEALEAATIDEWSDIFAI
jgi:hypothetical protein